MAAEPGPATGPDPVYRRADGAVWRDLGEEALVGRPGRGIERLGGAAYAVWAALEAPGTVEDLVVRLIGPTEGGDDDREPPAAAPVRSALAVLERAELVGAT